MPVMTLCPGAAYIKKNSNEIVNDRPGKNTFK